MYQLKQVLADIAGIAYPDNDKLERYQRFFVQFINKDLKSKHGDYHPTEKTIRVFNLYRNDSTILKTSIHELAHHVDFINRGKTDHSIFFYEVYKDLLYAALNMQLLTAEEILKDNVDSGDASKIKLFLEEYKPQSVEYKKDICKISVANAFPIKDKLFSRGYSFAKLSKLWEKEINIDVLDVEKEFLDGIKAEYSVSNSAKQNIGAVGYIIVKKGSYEVKDILRANDFFFVKQQKVWKKKIQMTDYKAEIQRLHNIPELRDIEFKLQK